MGLLLILLILFLYIAFPIYALFYYFRIVKSFLEEDDLLIKPVIGNSFLALDARFRKLSLDLAWAPSINEFILRTLKKPLLIGENSAVYFLGGVAYVLISIAYFFNDGIDSIIIIGWLFSVISSIVLFYISRKTWLLIEYFKAADGVRSQKIEKLRILATDFLRDNVLIWHTELQLGCSVLARKLADVHPEHEFVILSAKPDVLGPGDVPPQKIQMSYLFSNGLLSIVSGIEFDVKETSYTMIDNDVPSFVFTPDNLWSHDEFYFSDVTELSFVPVGDNAQTENYSFIVEGHLVLILSNGSKKQYASSRSDATSLLSVIRERVRCEKLMTDIKTRSGEIDNVSEMPSTAGQRFCTQCASLLNSQDRFCGACGGAVAS